MPDNVASKLSPMPVLPTGVTIAFVTHSGRPGGAELALSRYLSRSSLPHIRLVALESSRLWDPVAMSGTPVRVVRPRWPKVLSSVAIARGQTRGAKVVVANTMRAALYCAVTKRSGVKLVYWVRDGLDQSAMSRIALLLTRHVTLRRVDVCVANSAWTASSIERSRKGIPTLTIPSMSSVSKGEIRGRSPRSIEGEPIRLLYLGRLAQWKAPHLAVEALELLLSREPGRYRLLIAGDAQFGEEAYKRLLCRRIEVSPARQHIEMLGHVADVPGLLDGVDLLVHTSTRPEPFGQVIIQALGRGLPVVASRFGGPLEILSDGLRGGLYTPGSATEMASAITRMCDPEVYASTSSLALLRASDFCDEQVLALSDRVFESLRYGICVTSAERRGSPKVETS